MELVKLEDYNHIYAVDTFAKEYKGLFGKSKKDYTSYKQILETNLRILDRVDLQQALTYLQFEKLENEELYSIRHVSKSNPRVIFASVLEGHVILLVAFKEKRESDYQNALRKAKDRMKELEE